MTPERRLRVIDALIEMSEYFGVPTGFARASLNRRTDADLTLMLTNIEALLERAQGTDI